MPLHVSSTMCSSSASGIIALIGGRPVHRLREDSVGVMIPDAVLYNFDLLTMSTWCSKHVEA